MSGEYQNPITIRKAIIEIDGRKLLLPAIQRNFVWKTQQICALFDSLMRGYPVNSFMTWNVEAKKIKDNFRFYSFITNYCERFNESNKLVNTQRSFHDFQAVIDGQQRLTSIYIGLKGTYAYKIPRVWWPTSRDEKLLPPRNLFLNILKPLDVEQNEGKLEYDFRFLTKKQIADFSTNEEQFWFRVGEILDFKQDVTPDAVTEDLVVPYLIEHGLDDGNRFARRTLGRLYHVINKENAIHYYQENSQEIDYVLDVFIRTNSGGTQLEFADLLMSIAVASWDGDARAEIDGLVKDCWQDSGMGFSIDRDWVLKTCLMLTNADVRFRVKNFDKARVETIQNQWEEIKDCIKHTLRLLRLIGLNDQAVRSKNAIIPIAYYLYQQSRNGSRKYLAITNLARCKDDRLLISKWLNSALLKGIFGGQADTILQNLRSIIDEQCDVEEFPLNSIIEKLKNTSKDMRFTEEHIEGLLDIEHGDARCRSVLALLFPEMYDNHVFDIDHLHPASAFQKKNLQKQDFLTSDPDKMEFYENKRNWNSIPNLHLLNASQNKSKLNKKLADWVASKPINRSDLLLADDTSLDFAEFEQFLTDRRQALLARLRDGVFMTVMSEINSDSEADDEQVSSD